MCSMLRIVKLINCNTFIIILSEILQKLQNGSHYRCLSITLFLQHLALHLDHANIDEKAASHLRTADLALGQFIKNKLCGVRVSTRLRVLRDVSCGTFLHACQIQDVYWKCILSQNHSRADICTSAASAVQRGKEAHSVSAAGELSGSSSSGLFVCHQDDPCSPSHLLCHVLPTNEETNLAQHLFRVPPKHWKAYQQALWRCCLRLTRRWWKILLSEQKRPGDHTRQRIHQHSYLEWLHSEMSNCDKRCLW